MKMSKNEVVYLHLMMVAQALNYKMLLWTRENVQVLTGFSKFPQKDPSFQTDIVRFFIRKANKSVFKVW